MIDLRVLRDDPEAVKAALARRGVEAGRGRRRGRGGSGAPGQGGHGRGDAGRGQGALAPGRPGQEGGRRGAGRPSSAPGAGCLARRSARLRPRSTPSGSGCAPGCSYLPNLPADEAPDGAGRTGQRRDPSLVARTGSGAPEPEPLEHQQVPHWEIGEALRLLDMERGARLAGLHVPPLSRSRRPPAARPDRLRHRPPRPGLRGDPAADRGAHRHHDLDRVTCPSSPTTPITSSGTTSG